MGQRNNKPVMQDKEDIKKVDETATQPQSDEKISQLAVATLGAGCYWCVEAIFQQLEGVDSVTSGFSGGIVENPTYKEVCTTETGHAEVCHIQYDPSVISFEDLLQVFFQIHDPTSLNRQGKDEGTQYRSVIFYHTEEQRETAERCKKELDEAGAYDKPIVTEISAFTVFYPAHEGHQNYFIQNENENSYCWKVIRPKIEKFQKVFPHKLKQKAAA